MTKTMKILIGAGVTIVVLLALGIVIPNLFRSRMIGDHGMPGASMVRTINTTQVTYSTYYPDQGFAPNLAVLGPDVPDYSQCNATQTRACLLDQKVGCSSGVGTAWCEDGRGLYRYNLQSSSTKPPYRDYWITATPVHANPGLKNYCSLSDAVVRWERAAPLSRPYTLEECQALPEL